MADNAYQLVVRKGPRPGQIFSLTLETMGIGRDPSSDIVINDAEVSRHHARLIVAEEGYLLQDLGSTNGTFLQNVQGEETFVRRDSTELKGEGTIGLGRAEEPGGTLAIHFKALD